MHEKRRHARRELSEPVEIGQGDGPRTPATCRDLSLGGMHVDTDRPAPFGAAVTVYMRLPKLGNAETALPGVVRWTKPGCMGIQFGLLGARETHAITELLASED